MSSFVLFVWSRHDIGIQLCLWFLLYPCSALKADSKTNYVQFTKHRPNNNKYVSRCLWHVQKLNVLSPTNVKTHIKCIRLQRTYNKKAFPSSHIGSISRLTFVLLLLPLDFLAERIKHVAFMPLVSQTYTS